MPGLHAIHGEHQHQTGMHEEEHDSGEAKVVQSLVDPSVVGA